MDGYNEGNYIKINRSILNWEWYRNINTKVLFLHMLLKANWKDGRFEGIVVPRGSFSSSYPRLAEECSLTINEFRTALKHLIDTDEITVFPHAKFSVFTVNNYCFYQGVNSQVTENQHAEHSQCTGEPHSINTLLTTIEERKKERKEEGKKERREEKNNICRTYFPNDEKLNQSFADYVLMRKEIKKPMTDKAVDLAMKKLVKLSTSENSGVMDNDIAIQILEQSIMGSWQGLFELKSTHQNKQKGIDWNRI